MKLEWDPGPLRNSKQLNNVPASRTAPAATIFHSYHSRPGSGGILFEKKARYELLLYTKVDTLNRFFICFEP